MTPEARSGRRHLPRLLNTLFQLQVQEESHNREHIISVVFARSSLNTIFHHGFAYWIYGVMGLLAAWFMWKYVPETKGKTLEQMEKMWLKK